MSLLEVSQDTLKGGLLHKIVADLREKEAAVAFNPAAYNPAAGLLEVEVTLEVQDSSGDKVRVSDEKTAEKDAIREVQVDITGGTATGKKLQTTGEPGAVDASAVARFVDGKATLKVLATSTGTVTLALTDSQGHGLTVTSTATVTFS